MVNYALEIDVKDFTKPLLQRAASHLNKTLRLARIPIQTRMRSHVKYLLESSPEYISLLTGGKLQANLGLVDPETTLPIIVNVWLKSIVATVDTVRVVGNELIGGLRLVGVRANFSDVLNHPRANFISENGYDVFWIGWLLSEGTRVIVKDYVIRYGQYEQSRTGLAIMTKWRGGRGWRVPPEYAGVLEDNFVTRSLRGINMVIYDIIKDEITRRL